MRRADRLFQIIRLLQQRSARTIRPLGVFFWGKTWTLAA
jgi:predicted DNA-binding transcriptional regulator YafY